MRPLSARGLTRTIAGATLVTVLELAAVTGCDGGRAQTPFGTADRNAIEAVLAD